MAPVQKDSSPPFCHRRELQLVVVPNAVVRRQRRTLAILHALKRAVERADTGTSPVETEIAIEPTVASQEPVNQTAATEHDLESATDDDEPLASLELVTATENDHPSAEVFTPAPLAVPQIQAFSPLPTEVVGPLFFGDGPLEVENGSLPPAPLAPLVQTIDLPDVDTPVAEPQDTPLDTWGRLTPPPTPVMSAATLEPSVLFDQAFEAWTEAQSAMNALDHSIQAEDAWAVGPSENSLGLVGVPNPTTETIPQQTEEGSDFTLW